MNRTPIPGLTATAAFAAAAAFILARRFFGAFGSMTMVVPMSLWVLAAVCGCFAYMVKKRRDEGKVGLDRSQLNPMMAANLMLLGKSCAWAGSVCGGAYGGVLGYVAPRMSTIAAAAQDFPSLLSGALGGLALAAAGVALERSCEVQPPSEGEAA